jgi:hypothetical protein
MSSNKEFFESLERQYYDKNSYMYDRIRWFVFAQDQMTKKQLIDYSEDFGLGDSVNYNALKEDLRVEINNALARHNWYKWDEVRKYTEEFWKSGTLNYDPNWTNTEPYWADYDYQKTIPPLTDSINIEDNQYYQRLIKYSYIPKGEPRELKKIRPKGKPEKIITEVVYGTKEIITTIFSFILLVFAFWFFFWEPFVIN